MLTPTTVGRVPNLWTGQGSVGNGTYLEEGSPLLERWRAWMAGDGSGSTLATSAARIAASAISSAGGYYPPPLFDGQAHFVVTGPPRCLMFAARASCTLGVHFCPMPPSVLPPMQPYTPNVVSQHDAAPFVGRADSEPRRRRATGLFGLSSLWRRWRPTPGRTAAEGGDAAGGGMGRERGAMVLMSTVRHPHAYRGHATPCLHAQ